MASALAQVGTGSAVPVTVTSVVRALAVAAAGGSATCSVYGAGGDIIGTEICYYDRTCAVVGLGSVQCWGSGMLGDGNSSGSSTAVTVIGIANAMSVVTAMRHSCAVLDGGSVTCWGSNSTGQLGNGNATDSSTPVTVKGF